MPILDPNQSYTFSQIFSLKVPPDELLAEFGYSFVKAKMTLPMYQGELDRLESTQNDIDEISPMVSFSHKRACREFLIAPVVKDLIYQLRIKLRIDYLLQVTQHLQGSLDYLLRTQTTKNLVLLGATQDDFYNGFTQLATEMIALDQWEKSPNLAHQPQFIGAVTNGRIWQFGVLDRVQKQVTEVLELYSVPRELETVERILIKALMP
jgi:hypothetical protein